jgi:hypothetical protein
MKLHRTPSEDKMAASSPAKEHGIDKRRSTRMVLALPIKVRGVDALHETFVEQTRTVMVSCHGCKYQSRHYVPKGSVVTLEVPRGDPGRTVRTLDATVIWIQRPTNAHGMLHIGVNFEIAGNVWDIPMPPEDWFPPPGEEEYVMQELAPPTATPAAPPNAPVTLTASWDASEILVMASRAEGREAELAAAMQTVKAEAPPAAIEVKPPILKKPDVQIYEVVEQAVKASFERFSEAALEKLLQQAAEHMSEIAEAARNIPKDGSEGLDEKIEKSVEKAVENAMQKTRHGGRHKRRS